MRIFAVLATALVASVAAGPSFGPDVDSDAQSLRLERRSSLEKRGAAKILIASDPDEARAYKSARGKFRFAVNYQDDASSHLKKSLKGINYAPMIDIHQSHSSWTRDAKRAIKSGARYILGPNEPNEHGQSGKEGARQWKRDMLPLLRKYKNVKGIVGSVSSKPNHVAYMREFRKNCKNCRIAGFGAHIYTKNGRSMSQNLSKLRAYLRECNKATGGAKLYVTEYGSRSNSVSVKAKWIKAAMKVFRSTKNVVGAAAFPHMRGGAFVSGGKLTKLGKAWVNA